MSNFFSFLIIRGAPDERSHHRLGLVTSGAPCIYLLHISQRGADLGLGAKSMNSMYSLNLFSDLLQKFTSDLSAGFEAKENMKGGLYVIRI